jgi:short-subunit dehydrogenase
VNTRNHDFAARYGRVAVVAGASEGIGAAFAEALARRRLDLVLVARRAEPLIAFAERLSRVYSVHARPLPLDLADPATPAAIADATSALEVGLLICSAAQLQVAPFFDLALADHLRALDVNCRAPLALVRLLGERLRARGRGGIVLMSSLAGDYGGPYVATYAATKAFAALLAESLAVELAGDGIDVTTCIAGPTRTPTWSSNYSLGPWPMSAAAVAEETLAALGRHARVVPGARNRLTRFFVHRLPRAWIMRQVARQMRKHV